MAPSSGRHIDLIEDGVEHTVPAADLHRRLSVDALIRMHSEEYDLLPKHSKVLVHFNLEVTTNAVGRRYAVLPIVRPGRRLAAGTEMLPVVDATHHRCGTCTEIIQRLPLDQVTAEQFGHSLPTIRSERELLEALLRRYAGMLPGLDAATVAAKGCALTRIVFDDP